MEKFIVDNEKLDAALEYVRTQFGILTPDLNEKIEIWKKEGTISGFMGSYHFDYIKYSDILHKGFVSPELHRLFESLVYLHFFTGVIDMSIDIRAYVNYDKFDETKFLKDVNNSATIFINLNIIKSWCGDVLKSLGIKEPENILESDKEIEELLKAVQYAHTTCLDHYGDKEFLVSNIPLSGNAPESYEPTFKLNQHIYYSSDPKQIIDFAHKAKPGIYIIANVPYGQIAETAFYVLFRQKNYAYLVENGKHSYREQYYRNKTNGMDGQTAWVNRKYEYVYFPVEIILSFFKQYSESTEITNPKHLDFISIGKLTDCDPATILWHYAFIDKCNKQLMDKELTSKISLAACPEFLKSIKDSSSSLPAVYKTELLSLSEFSTKWDAKAVEVDDIKDTYIGSLKIKDMKPGQLELPQGRLVPVEHLKREVIFKARQISAEKLQEEFNRDFKNNFKKVITTLTTFIRNRKSETIERGLKDLSYKYTHFKQFSDQQLGEHLDTETNLRNEKILTVYDTKLKSPLWSRNIIFLADLPFRGKGTCNVCGKRLLRYRCILIFKDYEQFKEFYRLRPEEEKKLPEQFKKYLGQSQGAYRGNSILEDIDPMALITNPWWCRYLNSEGKIYGSSDNASFSIEFDICGICARKKGYKSLQSEKRRL